jgi:hypothetical protein
MLVTLLLAAVVGAGFPPAAAYSYAATLNGEPVGRWSVTVKAAPSGAEIDESSAASLAGLQVSAQAALLLASDLSPVRYEGHYRTPGQSLSVSVSLTPTSASVIGLGNDQAQPVALAAGTRHFVVIEPGLLAGLFALPAQLGGWKDATVTWITPTSGQAQVLSANATASTARPNGVPSGDAVLSIESPIAVTIWYDPATFVPDRISVPSQNAVLTRIND